MKQALLTTIALMLLAGAAWADIRLAGSARMGVVYDDGNTFFSSRVRIIFIATGQTDGGLTFGATVRHDQTDDGTDGSDNDDNTVFISGAFGKITMGNVSGAPHALVGQVSGVGYGPNDNKHELLYIGTIKTALHYEFTRGAITFAAGTGQLNPSDPLLADVNTYSAAIRYSGGSFSVAAGYELADYVIGSAWHLGGVVRLGPTTLKARLSKFEVVGTAYALSVDYATGPTTFTAFYATYDDLGFTNYGLGVAYDLGNGATLAGGIVRETTPTSDAVLADVGLKFSF